ncbi:MAG: hypothetical protein Q8867_02600 [Bacteroidota bacterium]|nr:hypothetical protein [Bacteroidota bacterium]
MRTSTILLILAGAGIPAVTLLFSGCTKEGPMGANGKDANSTCTECHTTSDSIAARIFQYDASRHASGSLTYTGTNNACAPCHTSQGFDEVIVSNADTTLIGVSNAAPINCRTCHNIHKTYTLADYGLKITDPFMARFNDTVSINMKVNNGSSNLCGRCHQAIKPSPFPDKPTSDADSLTIASSSWGPHYGPQALIFAGSGAFQIGATSFGNSPHKDSLSCSSCHMAPALGNFTGGHTMKMTSAVTGSNIAPCKACHLTASSFNINNKRTVITGMYNQLKRQQAEANILDTTSMQIKAGKKYSQKQLAVLWNFLMVAYDRSMGVHNYQYIHDMLQSGIDYYTARGY